MAGYIGVVPTPQATQTRDRFEATAGQTSFPTSGYTPGFLDVYANGLKINSEAYTATNGSDVVFDTAREAGDVIEVVAYSTFEAGKVTPDAVSDKDNESTGYFALPSGTTAERPAPASAGYTRYNTDSGSVEFYDGANWISTNLIPTINSVTGTIYAGAASTLAIDITNATETVTVRFSEGGATVADVNDVTVTSGSASVAVPAAVYGQSGGDTIAISILNQDGTPSSNKISKAITELPTGGSITTSGSYRTHAFTSSSTFVVPTGFSATADYLVVAGGGSCGGNEYHNGGGGAGGLLNGNTAISAQSYSIIVGAGGAPQGNNSQGADGATSSALGLTAIGGGGAGAYDGAQTNTGKQNGRPGGSGGGAGTESNVNATGGAGTAGQGNKGGDKINTHPGAAGGGGAGGAGGNGTNSGPGGPGGVGLYISWADTAGYGESGYFAGGGGGSNSDGAGVITPGGLGGGGDGNWANGNPGQVNTGGGAGGPERQGSTNAAAGGSGIVMIRYQIS